MPELPETETIARDLDRTLSGRTIVAATVTRPDVLREVSVADLAKRVCGATIERSWRRAKLIVLDLSTSDRIVVQPRFTGALIVDDGTLDSGLLAYSTIRLDLDDGRSVHYRDIRRLGTFSLMDAERFAVCTARIGKEPLDRSFTVQHLSVLVRESIQPVKKVLMDQRRIAGIGNIYANEALWRSGIDPSRRGKTIRTAEFERLHHAIVSVLEESIALRGTTFRDYVDSRGQRGGFAAQLQAYGRDGKPCNRCGAKLIGTHAVDGRATVFCARCQS